VLRIYLTDHIFKWQMLVLLIKFKLIDDLLLFQFLEFYTHFFDLMLDFNSFLLYEFRSVLNVFLKISFKENDRMLNKHDNDEEFHDVMILQFLSKWISSIN